jgi:hypothetical protein
MNSPAYACRHPFSCDLSWTPLEVGPGVRPLTDRPGRTPCPLARLGNPRLVMALLVLGTLALAVFPCLAKEKKPTSKTVSGQILDPKDNGLEGATVALKDLQTGKTFHVYTQEDGHYQFTDLRFDHDYQLQANYKGAKSEIRQVSSFDTRARVIINFTFPPPSS